MKDGIVQEALLVTCIISYNKGLQALVRMNGRLLACRLLCPVPEGRLSMRLLILAVAVAGELNYCEQCLSESVLALKVTGRWCVAT